MNGGRFLCWMAWMAPLLMAAPARADMVVIVSADSGVRPLSRQEVVNIFMGRQRRLPNGELAVPLDIDGVSPERRYFYGHLLGKTLAEVNAYWARLVFTGKTTAPEEVASQSEVLVRVADDPDAIGYVERQNMNDRVKAVYEIKD